MLNRRQFVNAGLGTVAAISLSGPLPNVLARTAHTARIAGLNRSAGEKILVVIQLSGGNDGINTLVPYGDDEYYKNRFTLAIPREQLLTIDDHAGMNPALRPMQTLLDDGRMSFVQGVGYPHPNRSHFESMDLWHTAHRIAGTRPLGWLGQASDQIATDGVLPALHLGGEVQPLALRADRVPATSVVSLDSFRFRAAGKAAAREVLELSNGLSRPSANSLLTHLQSTTQASTDASRRLAAVTQAADRGVRYPETGLAGKLRQIADLIAADLPARIFYVTLDGFDTHANQSSAHTSLLAEWAGAVQAFISDLVAQSSADRVMLMTFSEFGRRLKENASGGTDHGAASVVQLAGPKLLQPLVGRYPDLNDLDQGDLKFGIDYRQLYATLLDEWLGVDSEAILGGRFSPLKLV